MSSSRPRACLLSYKRSADEHPQTTDDPTDHVPKLTLILATAASMVCMLALFAVAALAAGPVSDAPAPGDTARPQAALCFLHRL